MWRISATENFVISKSRAVRITATSLTQTSSVLLPAALLTLSTYPKMADQEQHQMCVHGVGGREESTMCGAAFALSSWQQDVAASESLLHLYPSNSCSFLFDTPSSPGVHLCHAWVWHGVYLVVYMRACVCKRVCTCACVYCVTHCVGKTCSILVFAFACLRCMPLFEEFAYVSSVRHIKDRRAQRRESLLFVLRMWLCTSMECIRCARGKDKADVYRRASGENGRCCCVRGGLGEGAKTGEGREDGDTATQGLGQPTGIWPWNHLELTRVKARGVRRQRKSQKQQKEGH